MVGDIIFARIYAMLRVRVLLKVSFFCLFAVICFIQCYDIIKNFIKYQIVINISDVSPNRINETLPGITICNNNRLSLRKLMKRNPKIREKLNEKFPDWVENDRPQIDEDLVKFQDELFAILEEIKYDASEEVKNSTLNDMYNLKSDNEPFITRLGCPRSATETIECHLLTKIDSIQDRRCTTIFHRGAQRYDLINNPQYFDSVYNKSLDSIYGYFEVKDIARLLLDFEPEDYADLSIQIGARIIFHDPNHVASSTDLDFYVTRGYSYTFVVQHENVQLIEEPYGSCVDYETYNMHKYEKKIELRVPLHSDTCFQNCVVKNVIHTSGCWPPTMPYFRNDSFDPDLKVRACHFKEIQRFATFKKGTQIDLIDKANDTQSNDTKPTMQNFKTHTPDNVDTDDIRDYLKIRRHCWSKCSLGCKLDRFTATLTRTIWPSNVRLSLDQTGEEARLRHCCSLVTFKRSHYQHKSLKFLPKHDLPDTAGDIGGLLAVWLGFSMVSVYHIIQKLSLFIGDRLSTRDE